MMRNTTKPPIISEFTLPGHVARREWAVYVITALPTRKTGQRQVYVGKVGDNREGCNPIISRIGNHFSVTKVHSQLRNKLKNLNEFEFKVVYATFGAYEGGSKPQKDRINELERSLNRALQEKATVDKRWVLMNPHLGKGYLKAAEKKYRAGLLTATDKKVLSQIVERALI